MHRGERAQRDVSFLAHSNFIVQTAGYRLYQWLSRDRSLKRTTEMAEPFRDRREQDMRPLMYLTLVIAPTFTGCASAWAYYSTSSLPIAAPLGGDGVMVEGSLMPAGLCLSIKNLRPDTIAILWDSAQFVDVFGVVGRVLPGDIPPHELQAPHAATAIVTGVPLERFVMPTAGRARGSMPWVRDSLGWSQCGTMVLGTFNWLIPNYEAEGSLFAPPDKQVEKQAARLIGRTLVFDIPMQVGQNILHYRLSFRIDGFTVDSYSDDL